MTVIQNKCCVTSVILKSETMKNLIADEKDSLLTLRITRIRVLKMTVRNIKITELRSIMNDG